VRTSPLESTTPNSLDALLDRVCEQTPQEVFVRCARCELLVGSSRRSVEAQDASFALLERNVARNGLEGRVAIAHRDLRDGPLIPTLEREFDLVTGTPPYFSEDSAARAKDSQRAFARIEYRGGVEAYVVAAEKLVSNAGAIVLCGDARSGARLERAAERVGLSVRAIHDFVPRARRAPLCLAAVEDPRRVAARDLDFA
jgi:tRNA1(Val) A37 N6-methylase TrmN6